jgi:hypothetical protein
MIDVQVVKYFFEQVLANKDENASYTPAQFNSALAFAFSALTDKYRSKLRAYQLGNNKNFAAIPEETYLAELVATLNVSISTFGVGSIPSDVIETINWKYNYITQNPLKKVGYPIKEVTKPEFVYFESSQLNTPTKKHAVVSYYDGTLKFLPKDLGSAELIYYKSVTPFWGYTVVNNKPAYTTGVGFNGTTVQIPLADECKNDLVWEICKSLGISIKEGELEQIAQMEAAKA